MIKMALCTLLFNYDFEANYSDIEFFPGSFVLVDKKKIHLKIAKRALKCETPA